VAHVFNPSYSRGRDQEDYGSKSTQANSSRDPISKNSLQKRAQGVGPEFKSQYYKKRKKEKKKKSVSSG
jgi:hypothetical protein